MKNHLIFISIVFLLFSCSENPPEPETDISIFLGINKDVLFETIDNGDDLFKIAYCRFINNPMTPIEEWNDLVIWSDGCYRHSKRDYSFENFSPNSSYDITKDSENEFQFTINTIMTGGEADITSKQITTFKITGNLLEIENKYYKDNILESTTITTHTKSSQNIDNLNMCE